VNLALVVDDNVELATNVGELLETLGLDVELAHDADRAIAIATEHSVDLAIVDVRLPRGVSGVELVPHLREASPGAEIIIVTGNATVDSAVAAVRHGIFAYVQKPFDSSDFLALAKRALAQTEVRRERQRLANELARSEAMYRSLVETVDAAIVVLDHERVIRFANHSAHVDVVADGVRLEGRNFVDALVADVDRSRVMKALADFDRGKASTNVEASTPASKRTRTLRWSFIRAASGAGDCLAVGVDLTEVRELQLRTAEAEALGAIGTLTTGLAHEIRNPLNAASLQLELIVRAARKIAEGALRDGMENRVRIVRSELGRLERMLAEFLTLARPRALDVESIDVAGLFDEVVELEGPLAEQQGASLCHEVVKGSVRVRADVARVKQVLINLIANALDALRPSRSGNVRLVAERLANDTVAVRVIDDGPGVDETRDDVFRPFVTTKEGGTGLGLAIVRNIIEKHGGTVTLAAAEPAGTIATFTLPAAD